MTPVSFSGPACLTQRLGLRRPLVQAPMAGVSTPALVAAVSEAGALGSLAAGYLTPDALAEQLAQTHALTRRPFAVNLFASQPPPPVSGAGWTAACAALAPAYAELGLDLPGRLPDSPLDFGGQLAAVLAQPPAVVSVTFGLLDPAAYQALRAAGCRLLLTVTSRREAQLALDAFPDAPPDALVAQGMEAGGHRGGWAEDSLAPTLDLVRDVVRLGLGPVVAAGGLMTPQDVARARQAGAAAAQCGTAFLLTGEAGTSEPYRAALRGATQGTGQTGQGTVQTGMTGADTAPPGSPVTVLTQGPSGKWARGLPNRLTAVPDPLPYPWQHALTAPLRAASARQGRHDWLSLWAGTGVGQLREGPAAEIVAWLCGDSEPEGG